MILTSSASPISVNISGLSFRFHYLIQESGFDLTKFSYSFSEKFLPLKTILHCFFIRLPRALRPRFDVSDLKMQLISRKEKSLS